MSQFEDLPLPVNRDAQDYSRLVPANSTVEIPVVGEFVYCKFSDGSIRVVINGKSTLMQSGDERRSGGDTVFRGVTLINDTDNAKAIVFVIGFGGFDRKIIQGDVSIEPILRKADGTTVADTREGLSISLEPSKMSITNYVKQQTLITSSFPDTGEQLQGLGNVVNGRGFGGYIFCTGYRYSGDNGFIFVYDNQLNFVRTIDTKAAKRNLTVGHNYSVGLFAVKELDLSNVLAYTESSSDPGRIIYTPISGTITDITDYKDSTLIIAKDNGFWDIVDENFNLLRTIEQPFQVDINGNSRFSYNFVTDELWGAIGVDAIIYDGTTFEFKEQIDDALIGSGDWSAGFIAVGNSHVASNSQFAPGVEGVPVLKVLRDFSSKPEFKAVIPGCGVIDSIYKSQAEPQITANFTIQEDVSGVAILGQLIKASLEFYYRREVVGNYLDSVYTFDVSSDANGNRTRVLSTGNRSFASENIEDNFSIMTPGNIFITIDKSLQLGRIL